MNPTYRTQGEADARFKRVCDKAAVLMEEYRVPGVAAGIWHDQRLAAVGLGVTSLENPLEILPDTLFQIGSVSKTFTATLVMQLRDEGKLDLDVPVREYLPDFKLVSGETSARVTLRHLLTHMGGFEGDLFISCGPGDDALPRYVGRMAELPQHVPLGNLWSYCNAGFNLAGRCVEIATGLHFERAVKRRLFQPLGLNSSYFFPDDFMIRRFVCGHAVSPDGSVRVARPWKLPRTMNAAGGIVSSVPDLLSYARFHLGDGAAPDNVRLMKTGSIREMQTPQSRAFLLADEMGLAWFLGREAGARTVLHGGSTIGQKAWLLLLPEHDTALAVLTNATTGDLLYHDLTGFILEEYLGLRTLAPEFVQPPRSLLQTYVGRYTAVLDEAELTLGDDGPRLQFRSQMGADAPWPPMRVGFVTDRSFQVLDLPLKGQTCELIPDGTGAVRWLHIGGRLHPRATESGADRT